VPLHRPLPGPVEPAVLAGATADALGRAGHWRVESIKTGAAGADSAGVTQQSTPTGAGRSLEVPQARSLLGEAYSAVGVLVNIGVPVVLQVRGVVEAVPWALQALLWALFLLLRLDPVQRALGGGHLEDRNGRRTALGCVVATAAVTAAGVPEMAAAACGLVLAVHLQWDHHRALVVGAPVTAALVGLTAWAETLGAVPHASGSIAPWLSLAALGYAVSTVGNLAFLAAQQHTVRAALRHSAERDPLTGLLNRRALDEALQGAAAGAGPGRGVAVLFCDLDRFKAVNDRHGHTAGDAVLTQVAARLRAGTRGEAAIGRTGGDEFVVVLDDLDDLAHAEVVAARLRRAFSEPFVVDGVVVGGGLSIGVHAVDRPTSAQALTAGADAAMYAAKQAVPRQRGSSSAGRPAPLSPSPRTDARG